MSNHKVPDYIDLDLVEDAIANRADRSWNDHVRCGGQDYDTFFPAENSQAAYRKAKAICHSCPAKYPCLAEHLDEKWGCFGACMPKERRAIEDALEVRRRDAAA